MNKWIWFSAVLVGCSTSIQEDTADTTVEGTDSAAPEPVLASIQVLNPMTGGGMKDITVSTETEETQTKAGGAANIEVLANQEFALRLASEKILDHLLYGQAEDEDFELITFAGSPSTSDAVLGMLGLDWDSSTGMLVVGADYSNWSAVSGAQVSISDTNADVFVLGNNGMPLASDVIPSGGMGMVSFANVTAGEVTVDLVPPEGVSCAPHPGGSYDNVPIEAATVTVISYRCSTD